MDRRLAHRLVRHHADDLRTGDHNPAFGRLLARRLQHRVGRAHLVVGKVDADLRPLVVVDHPADRLHVGEKTVSVDRAAGVVGIDTQVRIAAAQVTAVRLAVVRLQLGE